MDDATPSTKCDRKCSAGQQHTECTSGTETKHSIVLFLSLSLSFSLSLFIHYWVRVIDVRFPSALFKEAPIESKTEECEREIGEQSKQEREEN
jgi:hypothetical protein